MLGKISLGTGIAAAQKEASTKAGWSMDWLGYTQSAHAWSASRPEPAEPAVIQTIYGRNNTSLPSDYCSVQFWSVARWHQCGYLVWYCDGTQNTEVVVNDGLYAIRWSWRGSRSWLSCMKLCEYIPKNIKVTGSQRIFFENWQFLHF